MEGGELFNRIQERTAFNERGNINLYNFCFLKQIVLQKQRRS